MLAADQGWSGDGGVIEHWRSALDLLGDESQWDAAAAPELVPAFIGPYRVLRVLGSGSAAVVYKAERGEPPEPFAIKVLRPGQASTEPRRRFRREAEVLARLDHPGINRVIGTGVLPHPDGRPYLVLEFVEGQPLLAAASADAWAVSRRLECMAQICDAVHYAHTQGVIHRDIKPSNIVVSAAGTPTVLDFGIARLTAPDGAAPTRATAIGHILGTTAYMSPEQASGDHREIDTRTDIYGLGAVAFHLLTGATPFDTSGASIGEAIAAVRFGSRRRPRDVNRSLTADAEAVVLKAIERNKHDRYGSASEFAADLRRAARGEPALARPPTLSSMLRRIVVTHPWVSALALLTAATAATGAILLARERLESERNFQDASRAADVLLNQVLDLVSPLSGSIETRRAIVDELRAPMARFVAIRPDDDGIAFNFVRFLSADADIAASDRRFADASAIRAEALRRIRALRDRNPADARLARMESLLLIRTGDDLVLRGEDASADDHYRAALALDERSLDPADPRACDDLLWSYQRLGERLRGSDPEQSAALFARQRALCDHLLAISPERPGSLYAALETFAIESSRAGASGEPPETDDARWQRRLEIGKALRPLAPATRACLVRIATDLIGYASHLCDRGRVEEARAAAADARAITADLAALDPHGADVSSTWEFLYGVLAGIAAKSGLPAEQRGWLLELKAVLETRLAGDTSSAPQKLRDRATLTQVRANLATLGAGE